MYILKVACLSYQSFRSFYMADGGKSLVLAFEVPNEKQCQHCEPISPNSRRRAQAMGRFERQIFAGLSYSRKYRIDLCSHIKPIAFCGLYGSARFAANPISHSRNQIIRISSWTILNFRFQKSAKRILSRRTKILKTENQ